MIASSVRFLGVAMVLGCAFSAAATESGDQELDQLLSLDIEDLTVSVASKKDESMFRAPGIISVITSQDMARYGARTLADVITRLPNAQVNLYGDNLLDEDILFPDINRRAVNSIPQHSGRAIYASVKV